MRRSPAVATVVMVGAYALGVPALAQEPRPSFRISAPIFFQHSFNTDLDGGGDFSVSRFATGVAAEWDIKPDLTLAFRATYELNLYDFNGMSDLGDPDPWDDIHSLTLDTRLQWAVEPDWFVFGGPVFKFARESGAPIEDGFTGGATIGATHVFNPGLIVGAGVFVTSELEDDVKVYPLIIFDWTINERWRLRSTPGPRNIAGTGLELVWSPADQWSFGVGGRYELRRFRLDDNGIAPGGVGEETGLPIWVRASWDVTESTTINLYAGVVTFGSLELNDDNGALLGDSDYGPTPTIALSARIEF